MLRVVLRAQAGEGLAAPPGRDFLVSSEHTYAQLAQAIDAAFARWDLGHVHEFRLADGRRLVSGDEELEPGELGDDLAIGDLRVGVSFDYIFDLGAGWEHECTVVRDRVDPRDELGTTPRKIVPIFGWGDIPDQYGRTEPDES